MRTISLHKSNGLAHSIAPADTVQIGHALVNAVTAQEAVRLLVEHASNKKTPAYVVTPNAQHVVLLESDAAFRKAYSEAALAVPDGVSLLLAARLLGHKLQERVTGVDLFQMLCEKAAERDLRVFLLGGRPGAAASAAGNLTRIYPRLCIAGTYCPAQGFERDQRQLDAISRAIQKVKPHMLFVAFGAPKQELWIYDHGTKLDVPICIGVGGAFDMVGGITRRAPKWIQRARVEWLFRMVMEPRRLGKRYLIGNAQFLAIVLRQAANPKKYKQNQTERETLA